jgi:SOS-response transcriptional repressor LexA
MSPCIELGTRLGPRPHEHSRYTDSRAPTERIYKYIVTYKRDHDGNSPTIREIMEECEISSTSMVVFYLNKLVGKGLIRRPEPLMGSRFTTKIEVVGGKWIKKA